MKAFFQFMLRSTFAASAAVLTALISFFGFEAAMLMSGAYGLLGGGTAYLSAKQITDYRGLKRQGLSRKEYKYIKENLKEAKPKIARLQRSLKSVRSIGQAKENLEILLTVRKIYSNTKKEPRRFYQAESFFYKHLDSLVALTEKYAYLSSQPAKSREMVQSLKETRRTVREMGEMVKKDLHVMLDDDMDTLNFELDVARQSYKQVKKNDRRVLK
ncbi:5-bromo-4-chloroindolyl phosphate hydrolysis family protein [Virgibacillus xinjiangensis]|uniref:5-bromo-4-chloroindolyl phosphate hydrolysis family protein n=1 Tax=Virgibacillus xinjiangensis TaxID=393090 RepID=A0ABV7CZH9_9BACI